MSKQNTSRSRAEKTRTTNTVLPPVSTDIVAGKYNDHDWSLTLERENSEEYINSIVTTILQISEDKIHDKLLTSRIIPFTVELAKQAMIKIIEWDFLIHDFNETHQYNEIWGEDEEPDSCKIDSWAQGYFPKRQASFLYSKYPSSIKECVDDEMSNVEDSEEELEESYTKPVVNLFENKVICAIQKEEDYLKKINKYENKDLIDHVDINEEGIKPRENKKDKKSIFKPYKGKIKSNDFEMLTETLYETELRLELEKKKMEARLNGSTCSQSTTSRQIETVDYEKKVIQKLFQTSIKDYQNLQTSDILLNGNEQLIALMKVPPEQLVSQKVKANHKMLETAQIRKTIAKEKVTGFERHALMSTKADEIRTSMMQGDKHPFPMSMLDSIDPVPGVTVQEGDRLKKSVIKKVDRSKQVEKEFLKLRPIKSQSIEASYLIEDIINVNQIKIKPIGSSTPIPAITSTYNRIE